MGNHHDLEVETKNEHGKAVIAGKTTVPFKTFVQLILQRKVMDLFKKWGDEPIIIGSELLTDLASSKEDSQENRSQVILVTLGVGVLVGIFAMAIAQLVLVTVGVTLSQKEYLIIGVVLVVLALLTHVLGRTQKKNQSQRLADKMEKIAGLVSKK